jgi:hypothetical protein
VSALSRLHTRAALEAFDVEDYVVEVPAASTLAELEARDAVFGAALAEIDDAMTRVMRIELDHALADDTSIAAPTRKVFAGTINAYANNVELLASRARDVAARGRAPNVDAVVDAVAGAATRTLALRDALRAKVFAAAMTSARDAAGETDARARDRKLEDAVRKKWSAWRRELEAIANDAMRVTAPIATRLASWPEQIDDPAPEAEVTFADMIEID